MRAFFPRETFFLEKTFFLRHLEFRYNLGSGPALIRTLRRVTLGRWHRAQAKRWHRDGMLQLDDRDGVVGRSNGSLRSLDISGAFVGGLPTEPRTPMKNAGMRNLELSGFRGCLRRLKIGFREVNVQSQSEPLAIERSGQLRECGRSACEDLPCHNRGTCMETGEKSGEFACLCAQGFQGRTCEQVSYDGNPCESSPCEAGGTCTRQSDGGYTCKCPPSRRGRLCQEHGKN